MHFSFEIRWRSCKSIKIDYYLNVDVDSYVVYSSLQDNDSVRNNAFGSSKIEIDYFIVSYKIARDLTNSVHEKKNSAERFVNLEI